MSNTQETRAENRFACSDDLTIAFGKGVFPAQCRIENISVTGLKIANLPQKYIIKDCQFISLTTPSGSYHELRICPRWIHREYPGRLQHIGFIIKDFPDSWKTFVRTVSSGLK